MAAKVQSGCLEQLEKRLVTNETLTQSKDKQRNAIVSKSKSVKKIRSKHQHISFAIYRVQALDKSACGVRSRGLILLSSSYSTFP
jgi:hypothetical protein